MIRYRLKCQKAHEFDCWFANSAAFDEQLDRGQLSCPRCGSGKIAKSPMAPNIARGERSDRRANAIQKARRRMREHVLKNGEDVGENFAREARKIHYEDATERGIYGRATGEEAEALREEGIEFFPLPVLAEDHN